jgi:hypothetical protein
MKKSTLFIVVIVWLYSCVLFYQIGRTAGARDLRAIYKNR